MDLSFLTVVLLPVVAVDVQVFYVTAANATNLQSPRAIYDLLKMVNPLECSLGSYCDQNGPDKHIAAVDCLDWFCC